MGNKLVRAGTGQTERFCAGKCTFLYPPLGSLAMVRTVHALCAERNEQRTNGALRTRPNCRAQVEPPGPEFAAAWPQLSAVQEADIL